MDKQIVIWIVIIIIAAVLLVWLITKKNKMHFTQTPALKTAKYELTFISDWGSNRNAINAPPNPHTGNFFVVLSNRNFSLFKLGTLASKGISTTAMYGTVDNLIDSIKNNPNIASYYIAPVITTPGQQKINIEVNTSHSFLSLSTMIAPSPDWFTGISDFNLLDNGQWIEHKIIPVPVYDAGTDSGTGFNTEHYPENNPEPISIKKDTFLYPTGRFEPIGHLIIKKITP